MLEIAYIGNGKSTNRYHLPYVLKLTDKFHVKTIYSRHGRQDWTPIAGVHYTTDIHDVLDDPAIDLVVITTPPEVHFDLAKKVLNHGKNALVEKPFTQTPEEAKELFDMAKKKGLLVQCYQNRRFDSDYLTLQRVLKSGKLGTLLNVTDSFDYYRPDTPENSKFSVFGSFVYGHACHTLDQMLAYFGKPDRTRFEARQLLGKGHMNDDFNLELYYGQLKVAVESGYLRLKPRPSFTAQGTRGFYSKQDPDRQETDLKHFYLPSGHPDFGVDRPEDYGTLTYMDDAGQYHEEKVVSSVGDYARVYTGLYETLVNGAPKQVKDEETIMQIDMLAQAIAPLAEAEAK